MDGDAERFVIDCACNGSQQAWCRLFEWHFDAVYRFCLATGWKAMKGDDAEWFLEKDVRSKKTVRKVWRRVLVDPNLGVRRSRTRRHLPLFQWSNPSIKDHLALFTHGVVGEWSVPKKVGKDYVNQMTAEVREEKEDSRGRIRVVWVQKRRDNHYPGEDDNQTDK